MRMSPRFAPPEAVAFRIPTSIVAVLRARSGRSGIVTYNVRYERWKTGPSSSDGRLTAPWTCDRCRKFAEAAREAREAARDTQNAANLADPDAPGLFAFINSSLGDGSAAAAAHRRVLAEDRRARGGAAGQDEAGGRYFGNGAAAQAKAAPAPLGRQALAAQQVPLHAHAKRKVDDDALGLQAAFMGSRRSQMAPTSKGPDCWWVQDALRMLRQKVGRLKAMAVRNAKDKVMASQVSPGPEP